MTIYLMPKLSPQTAAMLICPNDAMPIKRNKRSFRWPICAVPRRGGPGKQISRIKSSFMQKEGSFWGPFSVEMEKYWDLISKAMKNNLHLWIWIYLNIQMF